MNQVQKPNVTSPEKVEAKKVGVAQWPPLSFNLITIPELLLEPLKPRCDSKKESQTLELH